MKFIHIILIVITSLLNCSKKQTPIKEIISLKEASIIEQSLNKTILSPPTFIYVIDESGYLHKMDCEELKSLYEIKYKAKYKSLSTFLYNIVNQYSKLKEIDFIESLKCHVTQNITEIYRTTNIDGLSKKYCSHKKYKEKDRLVLKKEKLSFCEIETISYYFFINKYKIIYDDYHNEHYFIKSEDI